MADEFLNSQHTDDHNSTTLKRQEDQFDNYHSEDAELESCKVQVSANGRRIWALLDSGAYSSWIEAGLYRRITGREPECEQQDSGRVAMADGRTVDSVAGKGRLSFTLWGRVITTEVRVLERLPSGILLGRKFMRDQGIILDFSRMRGSFAVGQTQYSGKVRLETQHSRSEVIAEVSTLTAASRVEVENEIRDLDLSELGEQAEAMRDVLLEHCEVFRGLGYVNDREFKIELENRDDPVDLDVPSRRLSATEREVERKEVTKMLEAGVLEPSQATASTCNVFVPKKTMGSDGRPEVRTTSDMRKLNAATKSLKYPLPDITAITEWLASKVFFTGLDLTSGYWSVPLASGSRQYTAVKTVLGVMQYCRMVMGLKNSAAFFQQMIDATLGALNWSVAVAYQDDVSIASLDAASHVDHVRAVLSKMVERGLKVRLSKCQFGSKEVEVLGFRVRHKSIVPSLTHVKTLREFPEPEDAQSLLRFLGILSFLSRFVDRFAERAAPLYDVLRGTGWNAKKKKRQPVKIEDFSSRWGEAQAAAFADLRGDVSSPNVLTSPRQGVPKRLVTDASSIGYGAALLQWEGDGQPPPVGSGETNDGWRPILFLSRSLKGGEPRWTTTERECGAVVWAMAKLRVYLQGEKFEVVTDHSALVWLMTFHSPNPRPRLARWIMCIQEFDFSVVHAPGKSALLAAPDALSRDFIDVMDLKVCQRCSEVLKDTEVISEVREKSALMDALRSSQKRDFGDLRQTAQKRGWLVTEEDLLAKIDGERVRIVVPTDMRTHVVMWVHEGRTSGHWGVSRTAAAIGMKFWWTGWLQDVQKYVAQCDLCSRARRSPPVPKGPLRTFSPVRRNQVVAMDVLTISPASEGRSKVLVIGELLTRFVVAVDIPDEKASTIARSLLDRYVAVLGPPETLISDGGLESEVVTEVCRLLGTKAVSTLPYHPHGNGFVERYNRTLLQDLRKLVDSRDLRDWRDLLSLSVLRYNTSQHRVTGMTPFRALFGTDVLPMEWEAPTADLELKEQNEERLGETMRAIETLLHARTVAERRKVKVWYDQRLKDSPQYTEGQEVYVYFPQDAVTEGRKLKQAWRPMRIISPAGVNAYLLEGADGIRTRAHVDRIKDKPQNQTREETWDRLSPESAALRQKILGSRKTAGGWEWKVRTRGRHGYTWQKESDLQSALVENLHRTFPDWEGRPTQDNTAAAGASRNTPRRSARRRARR